MLFRPTGQLSLTTDLHSHLIPGVDDGAKTVQEAVNIVRAFAEMGFTRLITTPHISQNNYPNSPGMLRTRHAELMDALAAEKVPVEVLLGAEYMMDDGLLDTLKKEDELLSWYGHLLFETTFHSLPWITDEVIFLIQSRGLVPVIAHPERYNYFRENPKPLYDLAARGVKLQLTAGSLEGQYGDGVKKFAQKLLKEDKVDFIGSDVHRIGNMDWYARGLKNKSLLKKADSRFENDRLGL